jgi:hypothetical protein
MTCPLLTPWWQTRRAPVAAPEAVGGTGATTVLDTTSHGIRGLAAEVATPDRRVLLQRAHALIAARVRPVYALNDAQPASRTLARGRGSCSQRLAVLESVARASGIPTRCRGLLVDGRFWYPRFPRLRFVVPDAVLLAWPEFLLDGAWVPVSELFGPVQATAGFTNADGETLFDALARGAVDWDGTTSAPGSCSACDLSATVLRDLGHFDSRDELFAVHGQTLCWPARTAAEPVLGRWAAA